MTAGQVTYKVFPILPCNMRWGVCKGYGRDNYGGLMCDGCQHNGTRLGAPIATVDGTGPGATITWIEAPE